MVAAVQSFDIAITAKDEASNTFRQVEQEMQRFRRSAGVALGGGDLKEGPGALRGLNLAGRKSEFTALTKLLAGGGALIGVSALGGQANQLATELHTVLDLVREGKAGIGDIYAKLGEGLPIVGGFVRAWNQFDDAIEGTSFSAKRMQENFERSTKLIAYLKENAAGMREEIQRSADAVQKMNDKSNASMRQGFGRQIIENEASGRGERTQITQEAAKKIKEKEEAYDAQSKTLRDEIVKTQGESSGIGGVEERTSVVGRRNTRMAQLRLQAKMLKDQHDDQIQQIKNDRDAEMKASGGAQGGALGSIFVESGKALAEGMREQGNKSREADQQILDAKAEAHAADLKRQGKDLEAEGVMRDRASDREKAQIDREADEEVRAAREKYGNVLGALMTYGVSGRAERQKQAVDVQHDADAAEAAERSKQELAIRRAEIDGRLAGYRADASAVEARAAEASGNRVLAVELEKKRIADEYLKKRQEILKVLDDEKATAGEKAQAKGALAGLGRSQAIEQVLAGISHDTALSGTATAEYGTGGGGVLQRAQLEAAKDSSVNLDTMITAQEKANDLHEAGNALLQQVVTFFQGLAAGK
jgi:hypothetical protein